MDKMILIMAAVSVVLLAVLIIVIAVAKSYAKKYFDARDKCKGYENIIGNLTKKENIKTQFTREASNEKINITRGVARDRFNNSKRVLGELHNYKIRNDKKPGA